VSEFETGAGAETANALFSPRRLRLARETRMMTRSAVALAAQVTPAAVSQFERGDARPVPQTLLRLADALDFPVGFFVVSAVPSSGGQHPTQMTTRASSGRFARSPSPTGAGPSPSRTSSTTWPTA